MMSTILRDLRHGGRALIRRPGFAALAVLTLALGIGANAAIFSMVNAVLLQPLPFPEPERLVQVWETRPDQASRSVAPANYLDWRARGESYEYLATWRWMTRNLLDVDRPERLTLANTSGNFFAAMGVEAALGRTFGLGPGEPDERTVVLGDVLWRRSFGADPGVVGRTIRLDEESYRVLGVMPPDFTFPGNVGLWVRAPFDAPEIPGFQGDLRQLRDAWYTRVVGRLEPGANVANLLLVRAAGRTRELAVRTALGASRRRIVGHVMGESVVLGLAGGALGIAVAHVGIRRLSSQLPGVLPRSGEVGMDGAVLGYSVLVSLVTTLVFGAIPALASSRARPAQALGGRGGSEGRGGGRIRSGLVVAEVSLAVVLVLGAGLVVKSLWRVSRVDLGFETAGLLTLRVSLPDARMMSLEERLHFYDAARMRVGAIPGVERVGLAQTGPVSRGPGATIRVRGRSVNPNELDGVLWNVVTLGYFEALGVPMLSGRGLTASDNDASERVAVVNQALVRQTFPTEDPIGQRINTGLDGRDESGEWQYVTVVGVVADTRNNGPTAPARPTMYRPIRQSSSFGGESMMLTVRAPALGDDLIAQVRAAIWAEHPNAPIYQVVRGENLTDRYVVGFRFVVVLLGVAVVANLIPAWRAASVDPVAAMRVE